jgi:hypothetical protein
MTNVNGSNGIGKPLLIGNIRQSLTILSMTS